VGFNFKRFISHPARAIARVIHNPASSVLPKHVRDSRIYQKIGRPVIKIGTGVALGALTGGVSVALSGVAFVGLSAAGAIAGGLSSAAAGGLTSKPFNPVRHALLPAAAGFVAGNAVRYAQTSTSVQGVKDAIGTAVKKEAGRVLTQAKSKLAAAATGGVAKAAGSAVGGLVAAGAHSGSVSGLSADAVPPGAAMKKNNTGSGLAVAAIALLALAS